MPFAGPISFYTDGAASSWPQSHAVALPPLSLGGRPSSASDLKRFSTSPICYPSPWHSSTSEAGRSAARNVVNTIT